jgi:hypothetical protein
MQTATRVKPCHFKLEGRIAPEWTMAQPLPVTLEQEDDGSFMTHNDLFPVRGTGETAIDSLRDFMAQLVSFYRSLENSPNKSDASTRAQLDQLQQYVQAVGS